MDDNKKIKIYAIAGSIALLVIIIVCLSLFGKWTGTQQADNGGSWAGEVTQVAKEPSQEYKARLPTAESEAEVKKIEQALFEEHKKEMEDALAKTGITKNMSLFDLALVKRYTGTAELEKLFNSPKIEAAVKDATVVYDEKNKINTVEVSFRVENFLFSGGYTESGTGNVKVYLMDKQGNKVFPTDNNENILSKFYFDYKELGTDITLSLMSDDKETLAGLLKDKVKIGVQTIPEEGVKSLQSDNLKFDLAININVK